MARVLLQDILPYDLPPSLGSLRGPAIGMLSLPTWVHWGPQREADMSEDADVVAAYQAIVREGSSEVQEALLNRVVLVRVWDELRLPLRCRDLWENRFDVLAGTARPRRF